MLPTLSLLLFAQSSASRVFPKHVGRNVGIRPFKVRGSFPDVVKNESLALCQFNAPRAFPKHVGREVGTRPFKVRHTAFRSHGLFFERPNSNFTITVDVGAIWFCGVVLPPSSSRTAQLFVLPPWPKAHCPTMCLTPWSKHRPNGQGVIAGQSG